MWTRSLLKTNAKQVLARCYWRLFAACLIAALLGGGLGGGSLSYKFNDQNHSASHTLGSPYYQGQVMADSLPAAFWAAFGITMAVIMVIVLIVTLCWQIFLANPVTAGLCRFLMESRVGQSPMATLFSEFRGGSYLNVVSGMFWYRLKVFLWSLLLIIPGIVKGYEYRFVPFLLAENPHMSSQRAQDLSRQMTDGEKGSMFVLDLSFIGWYLLVSVVVTFLATIAALGGSVIALIFTAIAAVFGGMCVTPYYAATMAELYAAMREKAFAMGFSDSNELAGFIRY